MKIKHTISAMALMSALSAPAFATAISDPDVLYKRPNLNKNLDAGEYDFAGQHARYGSKFQDSWKFSVADTTSTASISIYDIEKNLEKPSTVKATSFRQRRQGRGQINTAKIFDTTNLTLSIFNDRNQLIGKTGENGTLDNLNLIAGKWYTIKVSGKVSGFYGSSYRGVLNYNNAPMPVPLGDTAPMLGSALALLAMRLRKKAGV
jgi:hypothetical protein